MTPAEIVAQERQDSRWAVPAAAIAGALPLIAGVVYLVIAKDSPRNQPGGLLFLRDHTNAIIATAAVKTVGFLGLAAAYLYLFRAVRARRPAMPRAFLWIGLVGALGAGLFGSQAQVPFGVVSQVLFSIKAGDFAASGGQTYQQAVDLFSSSALGVSQILGELSSFALAGGLIVLALNAMRVGLLPRAFGYIGIASGVFVIIPFGQPIPVVLSFWLIAVALLIAGRFPGGTPPAWVAGEALPWPSLQQQREERETGGAPAAPAGRRPAPAPAATPPPRPVNPGAARRKRKKRG